MKFKKYSYLIIMVLMLMLGIDNVYAVKNTGIFGTKGDELKDCYYMSDSGDFKARLTIRWHLVKNYNEWYDYIPLVNWDGVDAWGPTAYTDVTLDKIGEGNYEYDAEYVANWFWSLVTSTDECIFDDSVCFGWRYNTMFDANGDFTNWAEPSCPNYLVFQYRDGGFYWVFATDSLDKAKQAQTNIRADNSNNKGYYGKLTTSDLYFKEFFEVGLIKYDKNGNPTCAEYEAIFGSKNDPDSIRSLVDTVLQYVRVLVPILVILLGVIDFSKAVLAGKEDNMKKAQNDFIKRVLIGVAVFFVPLLVDVIMDLADIVWAGEYIHCPL